jgi:transcriptional regulator with XRE-family HTH domain
MATKAEQGRRRSSEQEGTAAFAVRLKTLRVLRGFRTARSFARALDIDENRYTRWERGEVEPSVAMLAKMAEVLGLPVDVLVSRTDFSESIAAGSFGRESAATSPSREGLSSPVGAQESGLPYLPNRTSEDLSQKLLIASRAHLLSLVEQRVARLGQPQIDALIRFLTSLPANASLADVERYFLEAQERSRNAG